MSNPSRTGRLALALAFLSIALVVLGGHLTGQIFPLALGAFCGGLVGLTWLVSRHNGGLGVLLATIGLAAGFRLYSFFHPASLTGVDPPENAEWMRSIVERGTIESVDSAFYSDAAIHYVFGSVVSVVVDVDPETALGAYALLFAVIVPLVAIAIAREIGLRDRRALAYVAILSVATTEAIRRTVWPVAQSHASLLWYVILLAAVWYVSRPTNRGYLLLLTMTVTIALTHKLPLVVVVAVLGGLLVLLYSRRSGDDPVLSSHPRRRVWSLLLVSGVITLTQWLFVSSLLDQVVYRLLLLRAGLFSTQSGGTPPEPTAAVAARPGVVAEFVAYPVEYSLYVERAHAIWLLVPAGLSCLVLYYLSRNGGNRAKVEVVLVATAACTALIPLGVVSVAALNPTRPLLLIEPVLVVLVVTALWFVSGGRSLRRGGWRSTALAVVVVLLLVSQVFAASSAADYANTPRYYLTEGEATAKGHLCEFATTEVHTDQLFAELRGPDGRRCGSFDPISRHTTDPLYNGNVSPASHSTVAIRNTVDVYLGYQARWRLTWEPADTLARRYHEVYDNDAVTAYHGG